MHKGISTGCETTMTMTGSNVLRSNVVRLLSVGLLVLLLLPSSYARQQPFAETVPVVDGEIGPCSVEFTVVDGTGTRVYGAEIHVQIDYGFLDLRHLDLSVGTNSAGLARFEGLPESTSSALFFDASTDTLKGFAFYYPGDECHGHHVIVMGKR